MVPINCDYEILSPLTWVVVNIWALPYWMILVLFVYFWNKMMFKMYAVVKKALGSAYLQKNNRINMKHHFSSQFIVHCWWQNWLINMISALSGWLWRIAWLLFDLHMNRDVADVCVNVHLVFRSSVIYVCCCPRGLFSTQRETIKTMTLNWKANHNIHLYLFRK